MKMEINQLRVLVFLLVFLRLQCFASDHIMCLTRKCVAAAAAAKALEDMTSTTEYPADPIPEITTTKNPVAEIHLNSSQTQQINRFSTEILWVSKKKSLYLSLSPFNIEFSDI